VVIAIHNLRKEKGEQAELLCEYKFGTKWWCTIESVYEENPKLVKYYLEKFGICESRIGYKLPKEKAAVVKRKKIEQTDEDEEDVLQECMMDHGNWLNFSAEDNPGYCKLPYHFFEVECNKCSCEFTHEKVTDGK